MRFRASFALLPILVLAACASTTAPSVVPPSAPEQKLFAFRVGFWVSLHHHLRAEAAHPSGALDTAALPAEERAAWEGALAVYKKSIVPRSYLFDEVMVALQNALAAAGEAPDLAPLRVRFAADAGAAEAVSVLERAAPVYRARLWTGHQAAARAWIAQIEPLVARHGPAISVRLAALYGTVWPAEPVPVDVLPAAGDTGAYTTVEPTRVSVAASDSRHQGTRGLEIVFHEASHGWDGTLERALDAEAGRLGVTLPRQLWHAVLFYLAGEVVRQELEQAGMPGYRPYIDEERLWSRSWTGLRDPVAAACDPWIRGERTREQALAALVASLRRAGLIHESMILSPADPDSRFPLTEVPLGRIGITLLTSMQVLGNVHTPASAQRNPKVVQPFWEIVYEAQCVCFVFCRPAVDRRQRLRGLLHQQGRDQARGRAGL